MQTIHITMSLLTLKMKGLKAKITQDIIKTKRC